MCLWIVRKAGKRAVSTLIPAEIGERDENLARVGDCASRALGPDPPGFFEKGAWVGARVAEDPASIRGRHLPLKSRSSQENMVPRETGLPAIDSVGYFRNQ